MITAFLLGPLLVLILFAILFPSAMRAVFIALFVMLAFYHFASTTNDIPINASVHTGQDGEQSR